MTEHASTTESADGLPSVSVIVPVYNVASTLATTAPSWLVQDHTELLIVDDGSTDGSFELLESITRGEPRTRLIKHEHNKGRAAARNTGIASATGDVLLFLDADMRPEPDFVRQHALLHCASEVIGVVSTPVLEGLDSKDVYHRYLRSRQRAAESSPNRPLPFKYFIIGYTSVKAFAVNAIGGLDEQFSYGEDLDFAYRLSQEYPSGLTRSSRPVVHHYDHGTLDDRLRKLRAFGRDNLPLLLEKHPQIADAANVDFALNRPSTATLRQIVKRWGVIPRLAAPIRQVLTYVPAAASDLFLRYLLAATIADAYRNAAPTRSV